MFNTIEELEALTVFNNRQNDLGLGHRFYVYAPSGTEKQTTWAMSIKDLRGRKLHDLELEAVGKVRNNIERISEEKIQKWVMNRLAQVKQLTEALMKQDAKFFIETREMSIPELAQRLELA